jgi:glycosyltransferase involved in cell wall biosynthesis
MSIMKILVSAYACEPGKGSEPGVGWNWVQQIARFNDVWVLTRVKNRIAIESDPVFHRMGNVRWIYYDLPYWLSFWKRGRRGVHLYYYLWQIGAYFIARKEHCSVQFDIAHHVTFVTYWLPSFLVHIPIPFIWGPVGGGEEAPSSFMQTLGVRGRSYEFLRRLVQSAAGYDPFVRRTTRLARVVLATTQETADKIAQLGVGNPLVFSQIALSQTEITALGKIPQRTGSPIRYVSIGNLIEWKGFHLGLAAFARLPCISCDSEYWIVGEGPERSRLTKLAKEYGVLDRVTFIGQISRQEVFSIIEDCDVLVHPSLHDSGGNVCIEAMAAGKPVICLDLGGPALQVSEDTGFKISAIDPEQTITDLCSALRALADNPEMRIEMGRAAQRRALEHFHWDVKGDYIQKVYTDVISDNRRHSEGISVGEIERGVLE